MTCCSPLSSGISGRVEVVFLSRIVASISYAILAAGLWQIFRRRRVVCDALQRVAARTRMIQQLRQTWFAVSDARTRKVREVMEREQEYRAGWFVQGYACWSLALVLSGTYQMHVAGLWSGDVESDSMSDTLQGPLLRHIFGAAVAWMSPVSSNTVNAQALYVAFVVGSICDQWLQADVLHHMATRSSNLAGNILFAAFLGRPGRNFVLNLLVWCSTLLRSLDWDDDPGVFGGPLQGAILSVVCAVVAQKLLQSEARALVAAMSSASTESAVQDLLGMMCDAMVVLDEHLVMVSPCPKLNALLLRCPSMTFR